MSKETNEFSEDSIKKKTIPSNKRKVLFWSLLGSGVGVIIIVALLLIFLLPKEEKYEIELSSNVSVEGEVLTGDGSYKKGESITIVAEEITGYRFTGWNFNGKIISTDKEYTFIIGEDTEGEYTANYAKLYTITTSTGNEYGSFIIDKSEAIAGEEVTVDYQINSENQDLHELKRLYYVNMQGEEHTIENNTFTMPEGNVIIYAEFNNLYNINLTTNLADQEVILEGQGIYVENQSTTIKAPKVEGYRFRNWTYNGEIITTNQEYTITKIDNTTKGTYIANYDELYSITVEDAQNLVTITGNKTEAIEGESVEFSITPNSDYRLISVKVNDETLTESEDKYTFEMPAEDVTISVTYAELYNISVSSDHGIVTITGNKTEAIEGESVEFSITPNSDYRIIEVKLNDDTLTESDGKYTFEMPSEYVTISVTYAELYDILVSSAHGTVTITGNKTEAIEGESVEFTIAPNSDYRIKDININNGNVEYSQTQGKYTFEMPAELVIISVTYDEEYAITIDSNSNEYIQIEKQNAIAGENVEFSVSERVGYRIVEVKYNETTIQSNSSTYKFNMPAEDAIITVTYAEEHSITIDSPVSDMVTWVSVNHAIRGEQITVIANLQDTVTEDYVTISGLCYAENGSDEKVTINQTAGQYLFTMPAKDITISLESKSYRRLDDFTFSGNAITGHTGSDSELTLPSYYETVNINSQDYTIEKDSGIKITKIEDEAFSGKNFTSITIPEGVIEIASYAFRNCTNLISITVPAIYKQ